MKTPEKPLTVEDLCALYGWRNRVTVWRNVDAGALPRPFRIGRRLFWLPSAIARHQSALARRAADAGRKAAKRRSDEVA
jgi:predicted DNA-binding transcriptional regulator AlpA